MEAAFVIVILGILTRYAVMKWVDPETLTLPVQAQSVADLIRRAQNLAMVRGQRMSVSVTTSGTNGTMAIACATGPTPCNTDTSLTVTQNVAVGNAAPIYFSSLGMPVDNAGTARTTDASYTLSFTTGENTTTYTVTVAALTGHVSVSP